MAQIIEARVIQKVATESEWTESTILPRKGEFMIVADSNGTPVNIKVGNGVDMYPELPYMFDAIQQNVNFIAITSNALPTPDVDVAYTIVSEGDYTFDGSPAFTVPEGHWGIANWDGSVWTLKDMGELPIQDVSGLLEKGGYDGTAKDLDNKIIESEQLNLETRDRVNSFTEVSEQLMNNSWMLPFAWVNSGMPNTSLNWIRTPKLKKEEGQTTISVSGAGVVPITLPRFIYWDASGNVISTTNSAAGSLTTQTDSFPEGTDMFAINVGNLLNIGVDPTNSPFANTLMVNYGVPLPYEPYGNKVKGGSIVGEIPSVVYDADLLPITNDIAQNTSNVQELIDLTDIIEVFQSENLLDKNTIVVGKSPSYGMGTIVDAPPQRMYILPLEPNTDYAIVGVSTTFGGNIHNDTVNPDDYSTFNDTNRLDRLGDNGSPVSQYEFNSGENGHWLVGRVGGSGNYDDTAMVYKGTLENIPPYEPYFKEKGIDYSHVINAPAEETFKTAFFEYSSTGGQTSTGRVTVYVHLYSNYYAGFYIDNVVNPSIRADLWRIREAFVYEKIGDSMAITALTLLFGSENEYVYQIQGASDSTGGFHGDEILSEVVFYSDGIPLSLAENIPLTECETFFYTQISDTYNPDSDTTVIAVHRKITEFSNGGYTTRNRLDFDVDVNVVSLYGGLACIRPDVGNFFYSRQLLTYTATNSDLYPLTESGALDKEGKVFYYNPITGLSAECTSEWINVSVNGLDATDDIWRGSQLRVWDRTTDRKYYHRKTSVTPFKIGDFTESEQTVKFSFKM